MRARALGESELASRAGGGRGRPVNQSAPVAAGIIKMDAPRAYELFPYLTPNYFGEVPT